MQLNVVYYRHSSVNVFKNSYNPKEICLKNDLFKNYVYHYIMTEKYFLQKLQYEGLNLECSWFMISLKFG